MRFEPVRYPDDLPLLDDLFEACHAADGHWPLGEHKYLSLKTGRVGSAMAFVAVDRDRAVASVTVTPNQTDGGWGLEMAVHPLRRDLEAETLSTGIDAIRRAGGHSVRFWVYRAGLGDLLHRLGFRQERELRQLRRPLPSPGEVRVPQGITIEPFRPGVDEEALLAVNNRAFAGHPENGDWSEEVLADRFEREWFDARGIRMAWSGDDLAGFCWTKCHPHRIGEIYVIATDPEFQGRGIGRALVVEGLRYLNEQRGAIEGMLYVDAANEPARALYEALDFYLDHIDRSFVLEL